MKNQKAARSAARFFAHFRECFRSVEFRSMGQQLFGRAASQFSQILLKFAGPANANHTKTQPHQSSLLPWSACCVQCFSGALLVVQAFSVRRSLGEQEQALGLEMVRQSLRPTCQSRRAQTEIDRDRERERQTGTEGQRDRGTETGGGRQSAKSGVRRTAMQPLKEEACQAWLMEEELVRKRVARWSATLVALAKLTRIGG